MKKKLIPLTKSNDDVDKVNERFSNLELRNNSDDHGAFGPVFNGNQRPERALNDLQDAFQFQTAFFLESCNPQSKVNNDCIPKDGEISFEQAL